MPGVKRTIRTIRGHVPHGSERLKPRGRSAPQAIYATWKRQDGYTLIEVLAVIALMFILLTISMTAFRAYARSSEYRGAVRETVALLRNARTMAVSEAVTTECQFFSQKLEIYRGTGAPGPPRTLVRTYELSNRLEYLFSGNVNGQVWGFTHPGDPAGPPSRSNCFFYARGTATGGQIGIRRADRPTQQLKVDVEALTGRVGYCADPSPANPCPT